MIDGLDALWGKIQRSLPSRGLTYECTDELFREYKGVPKGFTIRLTSYGDERWFQANSSTFDRFVQSIQFTARPSVPLPIETKSPLLPESVPTLQERPPGAGSELRFELKPGDPFWLALLKSFGEVFLMILLATTAIGIGKWLYSKHLESKNSDTGKPPTDLE